MIQLSSVSLLPVPTPRVDVSHHPNTDALYAGSRLNLTCVITLNSVLSPVLGDLRVTSVWTKLRGKLLSSNGDHITVSPISQLGSTATYTSTVMFNTLQMSDTGNYSCEVTVAPIISPVRNVMNGTNSSTTTIKVQGKKDIFILLTSSVCMQCSFQCTNSCVECKVCTCTGYSLVYGVQCSVQCSVQSVQDSLGCTGYVHLSNSFIHTDTSVQLELTSNTTRLPNTAPYNTFSLICTATVPQGVVSPKTFTWRRRIGSSTGGLNDITDNGDSILITSTNLDQPTSTSVLTVRETTAGDYRYCCRVDLSKLPVPSKTDVYPINVTGERCFRI